MQTKCFPLALTSRRHKQDTMVGLHSTLYRLAYFYHFVLLLLHFSVGNEWLKVKSSIRPSLVVIPCLGSKFNAKIVVLVKVQEKCTK